MSSSADPIIDLSADDPVLDAIDAVVDALRRTVDNAGVAFERAESIRRRRAEGASYGEIVHHDDEPLVQLLGVHVQQLLSAGSRLRRLEALALYEEGMTMDGIATRFGVSRQRVSNLLRDVRRTSETAPV